MKTVAALTACFLLAGASTVAPVQAQSVGEKTGVNSALSISPSSADFVKEAASSDMFEIESSKLAAQKADGPTKAFATQMIADHTKTSNELKTSAKGIQIPPAMSATHQKMIDKLTGLQGEEFTKQYRSDQVTAHKEAVSLFERYAKGGDNNELKTWAGKTLPALQHHLKMAQDLSGK
jgi:putative membrane protein